MAVKRHAVPLGHLHLFYENARLVCHNALEVQLNGKIYRSGM